MVLFVTCIYDEDKQKVVQQQAGPTVSPVPSSVEWTAQRSPLPLTPLPESTPLPHTPPLDLAAALDERWSAYRARRQGCKRRPSEDAVHDLRVSVHRLLAVLEVVRGIAPRPRLRKMRRQLKKQLDELDDLRDVQVIRTEIAGASSSLPQLASFYDHLQKQECRLLRAAREQLRLSRPSEHRRRLKRVRAALERETDPRTLAHRAQNAVDSAFSRAVRAYDNVDASAAASIHRLRIAFKRFRYMMEVAVPLLPDYPANQLGLLHDYQEKMGKVQDIEIVMHALMDFTKRQRQGTQGESGSFDPAPIQSIYRARQAEAMGGYLLAKEELLSFWRAAPNRSFPWESENDPLHHSPRDRREAGPEGPAGRQSARPNHQGPKEDAQDSPRTSETGGPDRPDPDKSVCPGRPDR